MEGVSRTSSEGTTIIQATHARRKRRLCTRLIHMLDGKMKVMKAI